MAVSSTLVLHLFKTLYTNQLMNTSVTQHAVSPGGLEALGFNSAARDLKGMGNFKLTIAFMIVRL